MSTLAVSAPPSLSRTSTAQSRETAGQQTALEPVGAMWTMLTLVAAKTKDSLLGSLVTLGPMRPVPPPFLWLLAQSPHLQPSPDLWVPRMARTSPPMVTQPLDQFPQALDPADMDLDMDLVMVQVLAMVLVIALDLDPVLAVCMDPI